MTLILRRLKFGTSKSLKICHINAQSLLRKMDEFKSVFEKSGVDIICVSETWFSPTMHDNPVKLIGFKLFRADRDTHAGGVAIYVRQGISCKVVIKSNQSCLSEFIFLEVRSDLSKLLLCCAYRKHRTVDFSEVINILENISIEYTDVIVVGDLNSNILTNSSIANSMQDLGLFPTNTETPTYFTNTSSTLLDIFFVSCPPKIIKYDQVSAPQFSHHDCIFLSYDFQLCRKMKTFQYRDYKNLDYTSLDSAVNNINWASVRFMDSVEDQITFLNHYISLLFNQFVPRKACQTKKTDNKPWFNSAIAVHIRDRDTAYERWKCYRTPDL